MKGTEDVELAVLCMIYDEDKILLQNRIKKIGKAIYCQEGM